MTKKGVLKGKDTSDKKNKTTDANSALAGLLEEERSTSDTMLIDNAWRGAEVKIYCYLKCFLSSLLNEQVQEKV